jgi:hypothetical protein
MDTSLKQIEAFKIEHGFYPTIWWTKPAGLHFFGIKGERFQISLTDELDIRKCLAINIKDGMIEDWPIKQYTLTPLVN